MSNFHSSFSTATKNCLIPSRVSSSLERERGSSVARGRERWGKSNAAMGEGAGGAGEGRGAGGAGEGGRVQGGAGGAGEGGDGEQWSSPFYENPDWLSHELVCHLENIVRQCSTHQHHLHTTTTTHREREREKV